MPQDIPLEGSEVLSFTPSSLEDHDPRPVFRLRAVTGRDKRFHMRLHRENAVHFHSQEALRDEIMAGLKAQWTPEDFEKHSPVIRAYWDRYDAYLAEVTEQAKGKAEAEARGEILPELVWDYPEDEERAILELLERVQEAWAPLRRMHADNAEFGYMLFPLMAAVVIKGWSGFDHPARLDRGYLDVECAVELVDRLKAEHPEAYTELFIACTQRMTLTKDTAKNFESPSPSTMTPPVSTPTMTSESDGKSPASAHSNETPENS